MKRRLLMLHSALLILIIIICPGTAAADEIILENGDTLTGKVSGVADGILTIETEYSEPVKIHQSKIKKIRTIEPKEIHLTGGEILKGKIMTDDSGALTVEATDGRSKSVIAWDKVASMNPPPVKPSRWKGSIDLGASFQDGNTNRTSISAGADATRRTVKDRYNLRFRYNYGKEEDEVTARNYYGAGKYDYFFTRKVYGYLGTELLKDKFKNLRLRAVVGPGIGYQFWEDEAKSLLLEAGISYFSEDLTVGEDKDWIAARLSGDLRYRIIEALEFSDLLIIYPSLENGSDYKLRNEAALISPLLSGWSLKLSNVLEHDGNPPEGVEGNDWYWVLSLQYRFN